MNGESDCSITCTPGVCSGAPCVRGSRVTVFNVVSRLHFGDTQEILLEDYPDWTAQDIAAAIDYCRGLRCIADKPDHYCDNCALRRVDDDESFDEFLDSMAPVQTFTGKEHIDWDKFVGGGTIFLGSMEDLRHNWKGYPCWQWAEELYQREHGTQSDDEQS